MSNYLFIESRDPFDSPDTSFVTESAVSLKKRGNKVTVFLVQNGVLAARKQAQKTHLPLLFESGVTVLADDFSLRERAIQPDECHGAVKSGSVEQLVDLLVQENTKAIWH